MKIQSEKLLDFNKALQDQCQYLYFLKLYFLPAELPFNKSQNQAKITIELTKFNYIQKKLSKYSDSQMATIEPPNQFESYNDFKGFSKDLKASMG